LQFVAASPPGLLERVYQACLYHELTVRDRRGARHVVLPIVDIGLRIDDGLRLDVLVERQPVVEVKAVEVLLPIQKAQLLTYLRLADLRLGLLIDFNVAALKQAIQRVVL
jgi:GxxExxY protein